MRSTILFGLVTTLICACGDDGDTPSPDAGPAPTPPRVIPGGGIGDGPIDGVAYVYAIDEATRMPVSGATVRVGEVEGTTDADGLFTAEGVSGPQTVIVKATNYRSEMWIGANGTNLTLNLGPAADPTPQSATLSGTVDVAGVSVQGGHTVLAVVTYSQSDDLGDAANEIPTPGGTNACFTGVANNQPCTFSIETRTGTVSLVAAIYDRDLNGTPGNPDDDTQTLVGWATRTGIAVTAGNDQTAQDLTMIPAGMLATATIDFGTPPAGHPEQGGLVGVELGDDEVLQLAFATPAAPSLLIPALAQFPGATYRLIGLSASGTTPTSSQSIVLRRGLTGTTLAAGTWLAPPTSTMASRTGASWARVAGATVHSVEYAQGTANLLGVTVFDDAAQFTIPDLLALPQGPVTVDFNAIGAPGLDVNDFALDADRDKLSQVSSQPMEIN